MKNTNALTSGTVQADSFDILDDVFHGQQFTDLNIFSKKELDTKEIKDFLTENTLELPDLKGLLDDISSFPVQVSHDEMEYTEFTCSDDFSSLSQSSTPISSPPSSSSSQPQIECQNEENISIINLPRVQEIDALFIDIESIISRDLPLYEQQQFRPTVNTRGAINARNYRNREKRKTLDEESKLQDKENEYLRLRETVDRLDMIKEHFYTFLKRN